MHWVLWGTLILLQVSSVLSQTDTGWVSLPDHVMRQLVSKTLTAEVASQEEKGIIFVRDAIHNGNPDSIESVLKKAWLPTIKGVEWKFISLEESRFAGKRGIRYYFFSPVRRLDKAGFAIKLGFGYGCAANGKIWHFRIVRGKVRGLRAIEGFTLGC